MIHSQWYKRLFQKKRNYFSNKILSELPLGQREYVCELFTYEFSVKHNVPIIYSSSNISVEMLRKKSKEKYFSTSFIYSNPNFIEYLIDHPNFPKELDMNSFILFILHNSFWIDLTSLSDLYARIFKHLKFSVIEKIFPSLVPENYQETFNHLSNIRRFICQNPCVPSDFLLKNLDRLNPIYVIEHPSIEENEMKILEKKYTHAKMYARYNPNISNGNLPITGNTYDRFHEYLEYHQPEIPI